MNKSLPSTPLVCGKESWVWHWKRDLLSTPMSLTAPWEPWTLTLDSVYTHLAPTLQQTKQGRWETSFVMTDHLKNPDKASGPHLWERRPFLQSSHLLLSSRKQKTAKSTKSTWSSFYQAKALEERQNHHSGNHLTFFSGLKKCVPWDNFLLASTISPKTRGYEIFNEKKHECMCSHILCTHTFYIHKYRNTGMWWVLWWWKCTHVWIFLNHICREKKAQCCYKNKIKRVAL